MCIRDSPDRYVPLKLSNSTRLQQPGRSGRPVESEWAPAGIWMMTMATIDPNESGRMLECAYELLERTEATLAAIYCRVLAA